MSWNPKPINSAGVELTADLDELVDRLAENAHDAWAARRVAEGWRYGPERDDEQRIHPNLVPYSELPSEERAYDRDIAAETVKTILACGYTIEARDAAAPDHKAK